MTPREKFLAFAQVADNLKKQDPQAFEQLQKIAKASLLERAQATIQKYEGSAPDLNVSIRARLKLPPK